MYAVVVIKGFQHKVEVGEQIAVQKVDGDVGAKVEFDEVLMLGDGEKSVVGQPTVSGATVKATIVEQGKGDKVLWMKKKRRKGFKVKKGHRQELSWIRIDDIKKKAAKKAPKKAAETADKE